MIREDWAGIPYLLPSRESLLQEVHGAGLPVFQNSTTPNPSKPTLRDLGYSNMQKCRGVVDHSDQKLTEKVYHISEALV